MEDSDFSGIDPLRVPEARRRIAALNAYLNLPSPTSADTRRFAESIGLSRNQFSRLAKVWRDHRDARLLVIGKRGAATRDYGMDPRAVAIANDVISAAGPATRRPGDQATMSPAATTGCRTSVSGGDGPNTRLTVTEMISDPSVKPSASTLLPHRVLRRRRPPGCPTSRVVASHSCKPTNRGGSAHVGGPLANGDRHE